MEERREETEEERGKKFQTSWGSESESESEDANVFGFGLTQGRRPFVSSPGGFRYAGKQGKQGKPLNVCLRLRYAHMEMSGLRPALIAL